MRDARISWGQSEGLTAGQKSIDREGKYESHSRGYEGLQEVKVIFISGQNITNILMLLMT